MPNGDWESLTVPEELIDDLKEYAREHMEFEGEIPPYWKIIRHALAHDPEAATGYDGSAGVEVVRMDQGVVDDIANATASSVLQDLDTSLR